MKRRKQPIILIAVLILLTLLPLLAYLQYQWQGQVSQGLRNQMQEQMRRAAEQFGEDFDREVMSVYERFQVSLPKNIDAERRAELLRNDYVELYERWNQIGLNPKLISDVFLRPRLEDFPDRLEHLNPGTGKFELTDWPEDLSALRKSYNISVVRFGGPAGKLIQIPGTFERQIPAVVIPIVDLEFTVNERTERERPIGPPPAEAIIKLNLDFIRSEFIPALAKQHLSNSDGSAAYNFAVIDRSQPARVVYTNSPSVGIDTAGDISADIFVSKPVDYRRLVIQPFQGPAEGGSSVIHRGIFSVQIQQNAERFIAAGLGAAPNAWELIVKDRSGSLDVAVAQARTRNLAISFGILLLLAVSVGFTLVSVQRERRLAEQQMDFVSAVSHELRTPLAVICSAAENLADGVIDNPRKTREYGALVRNEGRRLAEMVEQVLDFAGIQSGKKAYRFDSVDIQDVVDQALEAFDMQIRENEIVLEKCVQLNLPRVWADRHALLRALQNLIGNALKYGEPGKWISVRAESDSNAVQIAVEDRGPGISAADLPHIFEPFYRSRSVVDAQIKGNGLGLSLVQQIVDAHGATIGVDSVLDRGSTFKITIPLSPEHTAPIPAEAHPVDPGPVDRSRQNA